ncbi:hypothetical protein GCM10010182_10760 [Actinomadura cremea]|nr:hypothetical protein GCM10010182_10760 [Actinomadura cremea]
MSGGTGGRPTVGRGRDALVRLVECDANPFEVELYDLEADPRTLLIDRAQRRVCRAARAARSAVESPRSVGVLSAGNVDGDDDNQSAPRKYVRHRLTLVGVAGAGWSVLLKSGRSAVDSAALTSVGFDDIRAGASPCSLTRLCEWLPDVLGLGPARAKGARG